ncbi:aldo/keto reductase [Methanosphaera cuniculi]|uniref:Fe-S oxidoreductase n=1 Tax=Methanosphaera cuniculi TaxID=1077256 RepID=A0A2A2HBW3_9EURY|nr:aldo/keto reductase [Methanosphaera cuniculi]PAV06912.1 Fe-S oxidoreductase [Methanosphaera cuniculi]PWL08678.1 putative oxidoreductase [Methanosphaera cuniculi]
MKKLGFGLMRLPKLDKDDESSVEYEQVDKMAETFMKNGFNYFDTAYIYHQGRSEVAFKHAVTDHYPRESFIIADKMPLPFINKDEQLENIFQDQLERLGVDYIDYYLMHNVCESSEDGYLNGKTYEFLKQKKEEGYIKHLGFSAHDSAEYVEEFIKQNPGMEFIQLQINYLDWENNVLQARKCYEVAQKYNLPIVVMEPLKGGFLVNVPKEAEKLMCEYNGQPPIQWALRYVAGLPGVFMVLSGMSSYDQLKENIEIFDDIKPLNDEEHEIIKKVVEIINNNIAVECTGCNYCLSSCPENIVIPELFQIYNHQMIQNTDNFTAYGNAYINYAKSGEHGLAGDCIKCQACIPKCPQHINIPEELVKVRDTFEIPLYGFNQQEE